MVGRLVTAVVLVGSGFAAALLLTGRISPAAESAPVRPPVSALPQVAEGPSPAIVQEAAASAQPPARTGPGLGGLPDLSDVAAEAIQAVVNISSTQVVQRRGPSPFEQDPFFRQFFGDPDELFGPRTEQRTSLGSGVIVSPDGYIVTNNHVVGRNATAITVSFGDRRELPADIVGLDAATDLALLKIEGRDLPTVPWGDSRVLKVGQWVLAIGSPFQLSQTVTLGIVSALGRANMGFADYENFIQIDAAINPGNSGGALVNGLGELVGINTGILSQSGGYQGVGFAVPSELVRRVMDDLIRHGEVRRGSFGYIEVQPITSRLAGRLGLRETSGVWVTRMNRASEAYRAGMRPNDVILAFNGEAVRDPSHLVRLVSDAEIGTAARVTVLRDAVETELRIPIARQQNP